MKNILKFFLIVFLISNHSCTKNENFNQKQKTIIESIELGKFYRNFENQIDNGKYNNQIDSDIFISKQFTEQEILQLCNNKNPRIRVVMVGRKIFRLFYTVILKKNRLNTLISNFLFCFYCKNFVSLSLIIKHLCPFLKTTKYHLSKF